jgi:hypothetical protein
MDLRCKTTKSTRWYLEVKPKTKAEQVVKNPKRRIVGHHNRWLWHGQELTILDEASRLKRIQENQLLLSSLGIQPALNADASSSSLDARPKVPVARKKRKLRPTVYDRSGYIISLPNPGEKHIMACVELPSDRKIRGRIEKGEYTNCAHWAAGEERRWRIGDGKHHYQAGEPVMIGGVGPDFRWRRWQGLHRELRNELVRRGELNEMDIRGTRSTAAVDVDGDVNPYSVSPDRPLKSA